MSESQHKVAHLSVKSVTAPEGEKTIRFIATAPTLDRDLETIDTGSLHIPVKPKGWKYARDLTPEDVVDVPFLIDHELSIEKQIGSIRQMYFNADGELECVGGLSSLARAQEVHTLAQEGHLGNSISGTFDYSTGHWGENEVIYDAELIELSVVFKGANRNARILEVSKSLLKEKSMADKAKETPEMVKARADLEAATKAFEDVQKKEETPTPAPETPETPAPEKPAEPEVPETPENPETPEAPEVPETPEAPEEPEVPEVPDPNQPNGEQPKMADPKKIASKQVETPTSELPSQVAKKSTVDKDEVRSLFVKQFIAYKKKDTSGLATLNQEVRDMRSAKSYSKKGLMRAKAISYDQGAALYQDEIVSSDILLAYQNYGRVGALVNKVDILGAISWKRITRTRGNGFQPVGVEETKEEDQPVFGSVSVTPHEWALIVAWYDAIARQTPIAVYQQIINYIAEEYARLEDYIILSFAGVTTDGGEVFPVTGLVPILQQVPNASQVVDIAGYSAAAVNAGFGRAYGVIKSAKQLSIVANRVTWGQLATTTDGDGNSIFKVVGTQVTIGALGTFNVVVVDDEVLADDLAVMGAFSDYDEATRGGLETLFSREATVGNLNLFTDDASAVRANTDIGGKPVLIKSFALLDFGGES